MNYSRTIKRTQVAKRVLVSWVVIALVSALIGGVIGHITAKEGTKSGKGINNQGDIELSVFGAYDDRIITEEVPLEWEGELNFEPYDIPMDAELQEFIFYLCREYNVDFSFIIAVIEQESQYKPDVISDTNDYGLMGINQINHEELTRVLGVDDFLDPYQNVRSGIFIFRKLFERYQDVNMVLMAYNMGERGAARLWENGVFESNYSKSVMNIQVRLNREGVN